MTEPVIVPRANHPISRRDIDPDALRVLYRLQQNRHVAYLVGGSVRDLMLGRRPKDFDIGTDAHPNQIKRLFRNCWIIGRRFRLAHIKFGTKTIEVATFRKIVPEAPVDAEAPAGSEFRPPETAAEVSPELGASAPGEGGPPSRAGEAPPKRGASAPSEGGHIHRDNTFGTPEEDAFRRDFTINGLFYDVATRSVIDYVGGLPDLERRVIRSIGDPRVRFVEDPVRMFRAAVFAARLSFDLDEEVTEAIAIHRGLILKASPARLMEEYYKILRSGFAEASMRALGRAGLLQLLTPDLASAPDAVWDSLARLDRYRQRFPSAPPELTTTLLVGALVVPLGLLNRRLEPVAGAGRTPHPDRIAFGALPIPRKDIDRLRQLMQILPRLADPNLPPRVARSLPHRPAFADTLTWLEVFGDVPDLIDRWKKVREEHPAPPAHVHSRGHAPGHRHAPHPAVAAEGGEAAPTAPGKRRRRRRRRRGRGRGGPGPSTAT